MAGPPFGRENTRIVILFASRCYCAALFSKENGTQTLSIEFTHTEILESPAVTRRSAAHQLQEKLSNVCSLAELHTNERNPLCPPRATCPKLVRGA